MNAANESQRLKSIVIVGGGTAGWMTALALATTLRGAYDIQLVESDEIGIVGVGEATIPMIQRFNTAMGIDEAEFIKASQGTFKLGIEFRNWGRLGDRYMHGFGIIGQDLWAARFEQYWHRLNRLGKAAPLEEYSITRMAAKANKFMPPRSDVPNSPLGHIAYAYHFDASLYAGFLSKMAQSRGVKRIEGKIVRVSQREPDGFVDAVVLENGQDVKGELFVDCSGFQGLLIEQALQTGFEDWSHWLPCDRALAVPCESVAPLTPYTRSTAHAAGWQWRIPLQHRTGNGHVFCSSFMEQEQASDILLANLDGKALAEPRLIKFKAGMRKHGWKRNVVAIGLSSGFLEPLESTSIHLIQTGILRLVALFPGQGFNAADIAEYNRQTDFEYRDVRDFIIAHYKVTDREDSEFWRYLKHMDVPDSLAERLDLFRASARFFMHGKAELFREESWVQVLLGQGLQAAYDPMVDMIPDEQARAFLQDVEEVIADVAQGLPTHEAFIARHCLAPSPSA